MLRKNEKNEHPRHAETRLQRDVLFGYPLTRWRTIPPGMKIPRKPDASRPAVVKLDRKNEISVLCSLVASRVSYLDGSLIIFRERRNGEVP